MQPGTTPASVEVAHLLAFLRALVVVAFVFAGAEAIVFAGWHDRRVGMAGLLTAAYGACALYAASQARRGRVSYAAQLSGYAILIADIGFGLILPHAYPVMAIIPIFAVVAALPFLGGRRRLLMISASWGVVVSAVVFGELLPSPDVRPVWLPSALNTAGVAAVTLLVLKLHAQLSVRQHDYVASIERANQRLELIAQSSALLAESLDCDETLARVAHLIVPTLASSCTIEKASDETRACLATVDAPSCADRRHEGTALVLPLVVRSRNLGSVSCVSTASEDECDHATINEIARRMALALDSARLYTEAQRAIGIRDDFLAVAGHELRTPVTALQLQLEGLQHVTCRSGGWRGDNRSKECIDRAVSSVGRLAKLIDQLLDVSRISAGRLVYVEALELTSFVGDVVERFRETATAAGCHVDVAEARPIVGNWDRLCLDQIVTNLISNAIKYGRGESIELRVQQCGRAARLSVTDHGIGIEAAARQRIFERFARAVSIRNYPGLGLGLWIVDQCVRALGGTVRAESDLGVGTTFVVELPLERGTTTPDAS